MKTENAVLPYKKYHIDRNDERLGQFAILAERYNIGSALYPGSFVHVTPSFVFPSVTYIDTDKRAKKFFNDLSVYGFVEKHKTYKDSPEIRFFAEDYRNDNLELNRDYDLLISQYAGFVSQHCKRFLKIGGLLLVNNSHGDASMSYIDSDYEFIGIFTKRGNNWSLSEKDLGLYFIPKKPLNITKEYIEKVGRGVGYTKSPAGYLFKRIS
ncbi:hypothetical protein ACFLWK_00330 [Chloroflexota bacterium]